MLAMKLEENEFLREALETRVAEAERAAEEAKAMKQSATGDQLDRLREEADRNAYLRRLLKKAEQRRARARAREREASAKFEALQSSAHRDAATFALRLDRYEAESRGARAARRRAEKARNQALDRARYRARTSSSRSSTGAGKARASCSAWPSPPSSCLCFACLRGGETARWKPREGTVGGARRTSRTPPRAPRTPRAPLRTSAAGFGPAV